MIAGVEVPDPVVLGTVAGITAVAAGLLRDQLSAGLHDIIRAARTAQATAARVVRPARAPDVRRVPTVTRDARPVLYDWKDPSGPIYDHRLEVLDDVKFECFDDLVQSVTITGGRP